MTAAHSKQRGDPVKLAKFTVDVVHGEGFAKGKTIPTSFQVGADCVEWVKGALEKHLAELKEWEPATSAMDVEE